MAEELDLEGKVLDARVRQKKDTLANWDANELILLDGEQAFVVDANGQPINFKIGDGTKKFADLPYWIAYDQGQYVAITGTALPTPTATVGYSIVPEGTYTRAGQANVVVPAGSMGVLNFGANTWSLGSSVPLPTVDTSDLVKTEEVKASVGKNKFNKATIVSGHYLNKDNFEFPSSTYCYSDFIPVKPSTVYSGKSAIGGIADGIRYATFFGANKQPLNLGTNEHVYQIATTAATAFMKITITESGKDTFQLEEGSNFTAYEPYVENLKSVAGVPVKDSYSKSEVDGITADLVTDSQLEQSLQSVYNSMSSLPSTGSNAAVLLANNKVSDIDGSVSEITVNAPTTGTALFQVIERKTFNYPNPVANNKEYFLGKQTFTIAVTAGQRSYPVPSGINIKSGDTVAWVGKTGYVSPLFNNSVTTGWWQGAAGEISGQVQLTYQTGTIAFSYKVIGEKFVTKQDIDKPIVTNRITATRNANDYNSIRDIISGITDASYYNRYEILVPEGVWFEVDHHGKKYVKILGSNRDKCILTCDSTLTDSKYVAPNDFSYQDDKGKPLSSISPERLNVFYPSDDLELEGITISLKRGKYPVHLDNQLFNNVKLVNCRIKEIANTNYPVGIGQFGGQRIDIIDCVVERAPSVGRQLGIFYHNWNNQTKPCVFNVINTRFERCGYALIDELGSDFPDQANFPNCSSDSIGEFRFMTAINSSNTTYWTIPGTNVKEPDPTKVPYSIHLNAIGTNVDLVTINNAFPSPYNGPERPDIYKYMISDYVCYAKLSIDGQVNVGDLISNSLDNMSNQITCQKHTGDLPILGVALESGSLSGSVIRYVPKGKIAALNVEGAVASGVNKKLIFDKTDGKVKASASADPKDIIGYSIEAKGAGRPDSLSKIL